MNFAVACTAYRSTHTSCHIPFAYIQMSRTRPRVVDKRPKGRRIGSEGNGSDGSDGDDDGLYDEHHGVRCQGPVFLVVPGVRLDDGAREMEAAAAAALAHTELAAVAAASAAPALVVAGIVPQVLAIAGPDEDPPVASTGPAAGISSTAARKGFSLWQHVKGDTGPTLKGKKKQATRNNTLPSGMPKWDHGLTLHARTCDFSNATASFANFFDDELVGLIFSCTKQRMQEEDPLASPLLLSEVYDVLALTIAMGLRYQPSVNSYWDTQYFGMHDCTDKYGFTAYCTVHDTLT